MPFDDRVLVMKVGGKIFALFDVDAFQSINLKCNPDLALELREKYQAVQPGYHMNKRHWNTVTVNSDVGDELIREWTKGSYALIVASLSKKLRSELNQLLKL